MNVLAYCDERFAAATRQAVGLKAWLYTSPPITDTEIALRLTDSFAAAELVWFDFHMPAPEMDVWLNHEGGTALSPETVQLLDLSQAVIFMVNCYTGGALLDALKQRKPRAIIGGEGENFGGVGRMAGAHVLGKWLRRGLEFGLPVKLALDLAKTRLRLGAQTMSVKDARTFKLL